MLLIGLSKFSTNKRHYPDLVGTSVEILGSLLSCHFAVKPVVASPNDGCFLRLLNDFISHPIKKHTISHFISFIAESKKKVQKNHQILTQQFRNKHNSFTITSRTRATEKQVRVARHSIKLNTKVTNGTDAGLSLRESSSILLPALLRFGFCQR